MAENLRMLKQDKQSLDLRTAAELDDLYRTKINLEERLVELIRYKDLGSLSPLLVSVLSMRLCVQGKGRPLAEVGRSGV